MWAGNSIINSISINKERISFVLSDSRNESAEPVSQVQTALQLLAKNIHSYLTSEMFACFSGQFVFSSNFGLKCNDLLIMLLV